MGTFMTATDARKDFFSVVRAAGKPGRTVTITLGSEPPVIMMSAEEFEGWMETMEIMADPDLVRQLRRAEKEPVTATLEELEAEVYGRTPHVPRRLQKVGRKAVSRPARKGPKKGARRAAGGRR